MKRKDYEVRNIRDPLEPKSKTKNKHGKEKDQCNKAFQSNNMSFRENLEKHHGYTK